MRKLKNIIDAALNVILCPVHRIFYQQVTSLVNKLALLLKRSMFTQDSRNKSKNDGCCGRGVITFSQSGRSMIEMLGVLAIIAVLSVGGIAGYSKAMEAYKINRLVEQYAYLFQGLIEHRDSLVVTTKGNTYLKSTIQALGLLPNSWKTPNNSDTCIEDEFNNQIYLISRENELVIDFVFKDFTAKACSQMMNNLFIPLHDYIHRINFFDQSGKNPTSFYHGDDYCTTQRKCLKNISVAEVNQVCSYCGIKEGSSCFLVIYF